MKLEQIKKYEKLYKSASSMGGARILRKYLGLNSDFPVPLSLAHGVDMDHCYTAMDVQAIEPIHWSYNNSIYKRAKEFKSSIELPHPWLMLKSNRAKKKGTGTLVIGPPPGKRNDTALLASLNKLEIESYDLLLKHRGDVDASRDFWVLNGVNVITAGGRDDFFYDRLFDCLENYEYVIGCTLSSALFFAASIGCKCRLIEDYSFYTYDTRDYLEVVNYESAVARGFVNLLKSNSDFAASEFALELLGKKYLDNVENNKKNLLDLMGEIKSPINCNGKYRCILAGFMLRVPWFLGGGGFLRSGFFKYFINKFSPKVLMIKTNEIDIWLNGVNENNFSFVKVDYKRGVTEPGWAVD